MRLSVFLFSVTLLLMLVGIFILYESSSYTALLNIGDKYFFVKRQIIWAILGVILMLGISRIDYKKLYNLALPGLLISLVLLVMVFLPGIGLELKGSYRWINLGFIVVQPSEVLKITLTLYLAAWLSLREKGRLFAFLALLSLCGFLVVIEPDLGTAFIIASTATIVYFLSGAKITELALIGLVLIAGIALVIKVEPYRLERLTSFRNVNPQNPSATSYHVRQILIALGNGGITGVGFGNSVQKYAYLPENTTDSIFAIYAEEAGFIGSTVLVALFFLHLFVGFLIVLHAPDKFGMLLGAGIMSFIAIQSIVNIGSQVIIFPLTGVPLPFISYGGSSMIINSVSMGIMLAIARKAKA